MSDPLPRVAVAPTSTTHAVPDAIEGELEALRALYGDDAVDATSAAGSTAVAVTLPSAPPLTLSTLLDHARYPASARPRTPTLRVPGLSAAACSALLADALPRDAPVGLDGEVCLYDYCEAVQDALPRFALPPNARPVTPPRAAAQRLPAQPDPDAPRIVHGPPVEDRRSVFQGHVAPLAEGRASLAAVLRALRSTRKGASATHHTWALRLPAGGAGGAGGAGPATEECDDDGEKGGGRVVLDVVRHAGLVECVVVVSRWFGGVKLGPARFRHIGTAARQAVEAWIEEGPATGREGGGRKV